jgi:hypothetical protein
MNVQDLRHAHSIAVIAAKASLGQRAVMLKGLGTRSIVNSA